jgi:hypothetical protein
VQAAADVSCAAELPLVNGQRDATTAAIPQTTSTPEIVATQAIQTRAIGLPNSKNPV